MHAEFRELYILASIRVEQCIESKETMYEGIRSHKVIYSPVYTGPPPEVDSNLDSDHVVQVD